MGFIAQGRGGPTKYGRRWGHAEKDGQGSMGFQRPRAVPKGVMVPLSTESEGPYGKEWRGFSAKGRCPRA